MPCLAAMCSKSGLSLILFVLYIGFLLFAGDGVRVCNSAISGTIDWVTAPFSLIGCGLLDSETNNLRIRKE